MTGLFFDEFQVGQVFESDRRSVGRSDIIEFASAFDPNPFHLSDEAAGYAGLSGIIASGFHTLSISFRLFFDLHLWPDSILPSPGIDKVRWLEPLYPDKEIFVRATVLEVLPSRSSPDRGLVRILHETIDASEGCVILTAEALHRLRRRESAGTDAV